ncbi:flagellar basal body rod protein FlgC [Alphaproteobacteria bacterium GH1-50]|uniref:Flagellar basal body rod protein FlgC n=1 Tax=Kangsaoukella pontilimi TaxID=2691042 RepID=A0A7C9NEH8_9RHOB|nr:flagellar basal body rod protein FlgC [Kangsaoukella pontilimi]MXQ08179.1 flagellar basal body rod protein FlgC [Kangsaoukella pontilimi]
MDGLHQSTSISASAMRAQTDRLRLVSENIANAVTPGYRRKITTFEEVVSAGSKTGQVTTGPVELDRSALERVYDPSHPLAGDDGYFDGSNVDLVYEIADAREAQRSYEANLRMFDQARKMRSSLFELLRR